jgi:hypothetical protein
MNGSVNQGENWGFHCACWLDALALLVCAGCFGPRAQVGADAPPVPDATARATAVLAAHGQAAAVTCALVIRVKPPQGDALIFTLDLWCPADGRIRVKASKLDVDFCDALVGPDGAFTAFLARSRERVSGNLRDLAAADASGRPAGPSFLAYLALLVEEVKCGPLPAVGPWRERGGNLVAADPATRLTAEVTAKPDGTVASKRLLDDQGKEVLRLDYDRYQAFGQLHRPVRIVLAVAGDPTACTIRLRDCAAVPGIGDERMRLTIPVGVPAIPVGEFIRRLTE